MKLRRLLAGALLLALLAPALMAALPGPSRLAALGSPGGDCCVAMPCCSSGGSCGTVACDTRKAPAATASSATASSATSGNTARLAAGCPGPAPAAPGVAHHDPMIPAAKATTLAPRPRVTSTTPLACSASERANDPTVPPPRV